MFGLIRKFFWQIGISGKIWLIENCAINSFTRICQIQNPFFRWLEWFLPCLCTDNKPIDHNIFSIDSIKKRLTGKKDNIICNCFKNIISIIKHFLICCCCSKPAIFRKIKFKITFRIFCKKLKCMLGTFIYNVKNVLNPFFRHPFAKQIRDGTNKYFMWFINVKRFKQSIIMKFWFKTSTKSFIYRFGITIWTTIQTTRNWIPAKISPFDFSIIHNLDIVK